MSSADLALAYVRERFPLRRFVPLALLVSATGVLAGGAGISWITFAIVAVAVLLAILALRVLDDLADRAHDAAQVPGRITVRIPAQLPFVALATTAGAAAVALLPAVGDARERLLALLAALVLLAAWYALRRRAGASRLLNAHVVLLKYPLLVAAAAGAPRAPGVVLCAAGLLYVALLIHEMLDDRDLRGGPRALLLAHGVALLLLGALLYRAATLSPAVST